MWLEGSVCDGQRRAHWRSEVRCAARMTWTREESMMIDHEVVSREEWAAAREALLAHEKEHTRLGDELARRRRELPWVRVEKEYRFDTDDGSRTLAELFDGHSQLLVYHFMLGPEFEAGCPRCSSIADGFNGLHAHLAGRA